MFNALPLKRVLDGKSYNTETATLVHEHIAEDELQAGNPNGPNPNPSYQQLYRTRLGKFFFVLRNESFWNHAIAESDLQDRIVPIELDRAVKWMAEHCNEKIEQFIDVPEAGDTSATLTLRMDAALKSNLNFAANKDGVSMNSWCVRTLDGTYKVWKPETTMLLLAVPSIPHGHGLSFKKGVADGILGLSSHSDKCHESHFASYKRGVAVGTTLKNDMAKLVRP
jgi:hypothetical protein